MARDPVTPPLDQRRVAAAIRLRRLKSVIVGLTAAIAVGLWSSVGAGTSPAQVPAPSSAPVSVPAPADRGFFGGGSSPLGTTSDQAPVLRSQGS
jgi:hypothetical protein